MAFNAYDASSREARLRRADAGDYIKRLRTDSEMTQRQLADKLNLEYYTFISQMECGQGRLPPKLWADTAIALNQDPKEFGLRMLSYYDPYAYECITKGTNKNE